MAKWNLEDLPEDNASQPDPFSAGTPSADPFAAGAPVQSDLPVERQDDTIGRIGQKLDTLSDAQLGKRLKRGTTPVGRAAMILLLVGGAGAAFFAYRQSSAYEHRWDSYNAAQESAETPEAFVAQLRTLLPQAQFEDVQVRMITKLGEYRDASSVPQLTQLLDNGGDVRAEAARSLANIGSPAADSAKPVLLRVLPQCTNLDRAPVVWALAVLGEAGAADAIVSEFSAGTLQDQRTPPFDPYIIARVLGPSRLASDALINHSSVGVRTLVAAALAEAATPEVVDPLVRLIRGAETNLSREDARQADEDTLIRQAVGGLGRVGDPRAATPLFELMVRQPNMRLTILDALRKSTGARGLSVLVTQAQNPIDRRELAGLLRDTHDPAGADTLASLLTSEDKDTRIVASAGLAELADRRAIPVLLALSGDEELNVARSALEKLQLVSDATVVQPLLAMLNNTAFVARRAHILRALGRSGASSAESALISALSGDDSGPAGLALADLQSTAGFQAVMRLAPRPSNVDFSTPGVSNEVAYLNRTAAVRSLGRYGLPAAANVLMAIVEDPQDDPRLRSDAASALGEAADDATLATVLTKVNNSSLDETARRFYFGALWQKSSPSQVGGLLDLLANPATPPDLRTPAALALGYAASDAADARILTLLEGAQTRRDAAIAILLGGNEAGAQALLRYLGEDGDLRDGLQSIVGSATNNEFEQLNVRLWDSGQVMRRLRVAAILRDGPADNQHGFAWVQFINRLKRGGDGPGALSALDVRNRLFAILRGDDAAPRAFAAEVLAAMGETGLLMAARDQGGNGGQEARASLLDMTRAGTAGRT